MPIYVRNVALTTTAQDLRQLFEPYGAVAAITIETDRQTGDAWGFGCVEMPGRSAASTAMADLQGTDGAGSAFMLNAADWWVRHHAPSRALVQVSRVWTAQGRGCLTGGTVRPGGPCMGQAMRPESHTPGDGDAQE